MDSSIEIYHNGILVNEAPATMERLDVCDLPLACKEIVSVFEIHDTQVMVEQPYYHGREMYYKPT